MYLRSCYIDLAVRSPNKTINRQGCKFLDDADSDLPRLTDQVNIAMHIAEFDSMTKHELAVREKGILMSVMKHRISRLVGRRSLSWRSSVSPLARVGDNMH